MTAARNESITEIGRACLTSFEQLTAALTEAGAENRDSMPADKLERQFGRFKVWCGNLGALQRGKSSLDSRLRTNVLKHLARLNQTLFKSTEIASGARMPLEKQYNLEDLSDESLSGESEDDDEPPKELTLHMVMIKEILNDLYMLSFRIRNNSARPTSTLRIKLYSEVDDQTGIDKFAAYTEFDKRHVEDSLLQLRRDAAIEMNKKPSEIAQITNTDQYLINRLVAAMNKRRKVLRYWQRHAQKMAAMPEEVKEVLEPQSIPKLQAGKIETPGMMLRPGKQVQLIAPSVTEKTMLSKTEATRFDKTLDVLETQSIISYASTTVEVHGNDVDLPAPPTAASKGSEFLCPYCGIVCPARHGKGRAWRSHILQDLQPYICTYEKCEDGEQLFSSRTAWLEHERLGHRRVWHCFEHAEPNFWTKGALQHHLESEHSKDITEMQIQNLVEVSELSVAETRTTCPFCLLEGPFLNGFENHMAFHLQKFAAFSVSRDISTHNEDDVHASDDQSGCAQGLGSQGSQVSGSPQFDSRPPSRASDTNKQAFQSPPPSIWDEPAPITIFTIPFRRDPDFIEHGNILEQIDQRCSQPGGRAALIGLGGVGKSQLAIEHAYRTRQRSPETLIFWIRASNTARFEQGYRDIADVVKIAGRDDPKADTLKLVHDWLGENDGKWLIILDNVDDAQFLLESKFSSRTEGSDSDYRVSGPLRNYLPQTPNGSILITTRSREAALSLVEPKDVILVMPMNEVHALKLFEQKLEPGVQRSNEDEVELVAALDFMPLAIVQAAAYISQRAPRCSVRKYIEEFQKSRYHEAKNSIITTWEVSFDHIRQARPTAASLLSLMSFFDSQGIPEALVRNRPLESEDYNENKNGGEVIEDNDSSSRTNEGDGFEEDVLTLRNYSLITINADAQVFRMHKLVQQATQKWLEANKELEKWRRQFIRNLYVEFPTRRIRKLGEVPDTFPPRTIGNFTATSARRLITPMGFNTLQWSLVRVETRERG